jgi:hypothetical protein
VFGCLSYAHVPDNKRTKLDNKSVKCVLLGISEESKAYRLYDPLFQKVIVSRDVVFNEEESWSWDDTHTEAIQASLDWNDTDNNNNIQDETLDNNSGETAHEEDNGFFDTADNHDAFHDAADNHDESHQGNLERPVAEEQTTADFVSQRGGNRPRQPPIWMRDYDSGDAYSDDNQGNFALFIDEDP